MSFYNVTNPTSFSVVSDTRKMLTQASKLVRSAAVASLNPYSNAGSAYGNSADNPITAEQLIQGVLFVNPQGAANFYLPKAADLITLLMGPGGFDVSSNDIFTFRIFNISATPATLTVLANPTGGSGTSITVPYGQNKPINLQITINNGVYSYVMF